MNLESFFLNFERKIYFNIFFYFGLWGKRIRYVKYLEKRKVFESYFSLNSVSFDPLED